MLVRHRDGGPPTGISRAQLAGRPGANEYTPDAELDTRVTWLNRKRMRECMGIPTTDEARWRRILRGSDVAPNAGWKDRYCNRSAVGDGGGGRRVRQRTEDEF